MNRREFIQTTGKAGLILFLDHPVSQVTGNNADFLSDRLFFAPPSSSYPQVIWFWMNGNVSKVGITLDLEAMKRVGIGGVLNFDAGTGIPAGPVKYMSEEWLNLKVHALNEAARLGLSFSMHNCPGWSASGGPWITPELSMQQLTWSETYIEGGKEVQVLLPQPYTKLNHYRQIGVFAYPSLFGELSFHRLLKSAGSPQGNVDVRKLTGEDPAGVTVRPVDDEKESWLLLEFKHPYALRSLSFLISSNNREAAKGETGILGKRTSIVLETSDDGSTFKTLVEISTGSEAELASGNKFITYDVPVTTSRMFRIRSRDERNYRQLRFSSAIRMNGWMEKTNHRHMYSGDKNSPLYSANEQQVPAEFIVNPAEVVDISQHISSSGMLKWRAPAGDWTILRFGHTSTGAENAAAPAGGEGLECDKYSKQAIEFHFNSMLASLQPFIQKVKSKVNFAMEIDSYEAGMQNWTPGFQEAFRNSRGYALSEYMPALTGRVVKSVHDTDAFYWDFRKVQGELMANNYYGWFRERCSQQGFRSYSQPYDRAPMEEMQAGARTNMNLSEFWYGLFSILQNNLSIRRTPTLVASIAHVNNKPVAAAEAFTAEPESSSWREYPFAMKAPGDKIFTRGINRFFIHAYAHQPHPSVKPGMTMGPWGIHMNRNNTWWSQSKPWLTYVSRCQWLLEQGRFVADFAYLAGEEANVYTRTNREDLHPVPPDGYHYDMINAETLINKAAVKDGHLQLEGGMKYRVLVVQQFRVMSLPLLYKLHQLVKEGLIIFGSQPSGLAGVSGKDDGETFRKIISDLWGDKEATSETQNKFGKGLVAWSDFGELLKHLKLPPDFEFTSATKTASVPFIHRKAGDLDIYFISNQKRTYEKLSGTFRVTGKKPELWDPVTGKKTAALVYEERHARMCVAVNLAAYQSMFIVFQDAVVKRSVVSIRKDNDILMQASPLPHSDESLYGDIANDFCLSFHAKPEMNAMLEPSILMGEVNAPWTDHYAIYPACGSERYGPGHACCGVAVGRNGIAVWENEDGTPVMVLAATLPIASWQHIAINYRNKTPHVYAGGKLIASGKQSAFTVHPALGESQLPSWQSYFQGDLGKIALVNMPLTDSDVKELTQAISRPATVYPFTVFEDGKNGQLVFMENGGYDIGYNDGMTKRIVVSEVRDAVAVTGHWKLRFPQNAGPPASIEMNELIPLNEHPQEGVRFFSGQVSYTNTFRLPANYLSDKHRVFLDLGTVEVIAEVYVNKKPVSVLWTRPYRLDITRYAIVGDNVLEVEVTNLWPNRLIGDEQFPDSENYVEGAGSSGLAALSGGAIEEMPSWYTEQRNKPVSPRHTFATWKHYNKDSALFDSGLLGPVVIYSGVSLNVFT